MKKENTKLRVLCVECTHRNSCPDAERLLFERPGEVERIVEEWAKNHPKPPTWRKWLGSHGITVRCDGTLEFDRPSDADKPVPEILWKE